MADANGSLLSENISEESCQQDGLFQIIFNIF